MKDNYIILNRHNKPLNVDEDTKREIFYLRRKLIKYEKSLARLTNWGVSDLRPRHAWAAMSLLRHNEWLEIYSVQPSPSEVEEAIIPVTILRGHR